MRRLKSAKMLILFVTLSLINSPLSHSQTSKPKVKIKVDEENYKIVGEKVLIPLYTIIGGRQYFIDHLQRINVGIPEPLVDPTGSYVFYTSNTGCGFEQDGKTVFVSDVYGKKKSPILGRCMGVHGERFLTFQGKNYLLITGGTEAGDCYLWLYDIRRREFVVHAEGGIREIKKGVFSYGYCEGGIEFKQIGTVTMRTLIRREAPLRLLPRYPTHGITQARDVRVYPSVTECNINSDKPHKTISKRGTRVLILRECEDGGYEIYYDGFRGKVMKGSIRPVKFGPRK
jgi:hypothetical protein